MNTAEKIRRLRLQKGLTQEELGKLVGIQKSAINKYEKGRVVNIKRSTLQLLADALGVAPVDLLDDDETVFADDEKRNRLIYYFNKLDPDKAEVLLSVAESLAEPKKG